MIISKNLSSFFRWFLFLSFALLLYFFFTFPPDQIPPLLIRANDKALHFLNFLLLALFGFRAFFHSSHPLFSAQADKKATSLSFGYSVFLEWAQSGVPGRDPSFWDLVANAGGIFAALLTIWLSKKSAFHS